MTKCYLGPHDQLSVWVMLVSLYSEVSHFNRFHCIPHMEYTQTLQIKSP